MPNASHLEALMETQQGGPGSRPTEPSIAPGRSPVIPLDPGPQVLLDNQNSDEKDVVYFVENVTAFSGALGSHITLGHEIYGICGVGCRAGRGEAGPCAGNRLLT